MDNTNTINSNPFQKGEKINENVDDFESIAATPLNARILIALLVFEVLYLVVSV